MKVIIFAVILAGSATLSAVGRAGTIANFDLDARDEFNLFELPLDAGSYAISLRNGTFMAWSNFETTSEGCTDDCLQGWLNFFSLHNVQTNESVYVENGIGTPAPEYDFNARLAYSTQEAALAAAAPYELMLQSPATIQISIPDCPGCSIDNRGGLSFTVALIPEPLTLGLVAMGIAIYFVGRRVER